MYTLLVQLLFYSNKGASTKNLSRLVDLSGRRALRKSVKKGKFVRKIFFLNNVYEALKICGK